MVEVENVQHEQFTVTEEVKVRMELTLSGTHSVTPSGAVEPVRL